MSPIPLKGIIRSGRVEVPEPIDLPDGTEVFVTAGVSSREVARPICQEDRAPVGPATEWLQQLGFMTEDEQGDDPVLVQRWIDDLLSLPPFPENHQHEVEWRAWEEKFRQFNIEAVRKQFEEGTP